MGARSWRENKSGPSKRQSRTSDEEGGEGGGGKRAAVPCGPVEPDTSVDTSSLWMDLFSLDSVILIIVTYNCLPFSYSRSIFRRQISWQVLKITFRSPQIWKFRPPYKARAIGIRDNAPLHPRYKKSSCNPECALLITWRTKPTSKRI